MNSNKVRYALIGGVALSFYHKPRYTKDIDILTIPPDFPLICDILNESAFEETAQPWTFEKTEIELHRFTKIENEDVLPVDILIGKELWHKEMVENAEMIESDNGCIRLISKENLIKLKLIRASDQDLLDIKNLRRPENDQV